MYLYIYLTAICCKSHLPSALEISQLNWYKTQLGNRWGVSGGGCSFDIH